MTIFTSYGIHNIRQFTLWNTPCMEHWKTSSADFLSLQIYSRKASAFREFFALLRKAVL